MTKQSELRLLHFVRNDNNHRTGLPYNFPCPYKSGWEHRKHFNELIKSIAEVSYFKISYFLKLIFQTFRAFNLKIE